MKKFLCFMFMLFAGSTWLFAQSGEVQGKVTDAKTGEGIPFASVTLTVNGTFQGAQTDFDGFYTIKPLPAGSYDVKASYVGYQDQQTNGVIVNADKITFLDIQLSQGIELQTVEIKSYKVPLLQSDQTSTGSTVTKEDIVNLPTRNVASVASQAAGVYQKDEGGGVNIKGSRENGTDYYIDGIRIRGSANLPQSAIEQLTVVTGGLPARYGDATGGIINITTRGPSSQFSGGFELATSKFLDPYGYYLGNFNVSGPILKVKKGSTGERTVLGFFVSGEYSHEDDDDPSYVGVWSVKEDVLNEIIANPLLRRTDTESGLSNATAYATLDDFENLKVRRNFKRDNYSIAGKLDFQPVQGLNFTVGATYNYAVGGIGNSLYTRDYLRRFELFNSAHTPKTEQLDYRGYFRITQRLGQNKDANDASGEKKKASVLQNAFYSIQFDYNKNKQKAYDPIFKDNIFEYGHVSGFNLYNQPVYLYRNEANNLDGVYLASYADRYVEPIYNSTNTVRQNYIKNYYELAGSDTAGFYSTIFQLPMRNGSIASSVEAPYSLWYDPGTPHDGYFKRDNDQYRVFFNGSFDLKKPGASDRNKHAIEFGFEYEQRVDRFFSLTPSFLWDLMYQEIGRWNNGIGFDTDNPILNIDGQQYTLQQYTDLQNSGSPITFDSNDTITYNLIRTDQSYFDQRFRERFGYGATDFVSIYSKNPGDYSLDMFSADELFRSGGNAAAVDYSGYDYMGNKLSKQPAFEDFWTATDAFGNKTRPQAAFRPVYMAGFLQDKFAFKDIIFNIGVRVDRYDANQKVSKDIYSPLFAVKTAGEVDNLGAHPSTIGNDYVVYVDDPNNPSQIKGYRDGNNWYNSNGLAVVNPSIISEGARIYPYLVEGQANSQRADNYDPTLAFEDYKPQISVMPRIAFSFEISQEAIFFAHYDILTQRPPGRNLMAPADYYFFDQTAIQGALQNPNLKPEKTIDYQLGFKQKLSESSALTISGFYRELRNMLQLYNVTYAYPAFQYTTYGNIDFGTVKGLEFSYDLRRTKNVRMTATYTLQFADGTGSGDRSQVNLVNNGRPNLRAIFPLSYDSRHLLNISFDYRFGEGAEYNGPKLFGSDILANTGLNLLFRGRSGEPYTRQVNPTPDAQFGVSTRSQLDGTVNGSRLPFNYRVDARLDKDFKLYNKKKSGDASYVSVYLLVQNLLNTDNVTGVYAYTGSSRDDGYIASPQGQAIAAGQTDPTAFADQYTLKVVNPENLNLPRRIRLGLLFNF